jgi:RND family efflux transporter MFP subunit
MKRLSSVITALLAISAMACGRSEAPAPAEERGAPVPVTVAVATMAPVAEWLEAGGVVTAESSATLTSRVMAAVTNVHARAGDRVRTGDVLVTLDDRDTAAGERQAAASVGAAEQALAAVVAEQAAATADLKLAAAWHARIASLHGRRSATAQELDEAEARLTGANARLEGAKARVAQATAQVTAAREAAAVAAAAHSFGLVRAPFDGLVTERLIDPGNMASPGTPLLRFDAGGPPQIEATVDEARVPHIRVGDRVAVLFEAVTDAAPAEGVVIEIGRAVAAGARAFTIKVRIPRAGAPRTGTFARIRFRGPSRQSLIVPVAAVRRQGQLSTVFVVEEGVARLRLIRTGAESADGVEVLAGLAGGDAIVTDAPAGLSDGRPVAVANRAAAGARP